GGGDDALGVLRNELAVHARLAVVALERCDAGEPEKIAQAGGSAGQHCHVGVGAGTGDVAALTELVGITLRRLTPEDRLLDMPARRREIGLDADDRLDVTLPGTPI